MFKLKTERGQLELLVSWHSQTKQVTLCNSLLFFLVQDVHPCSVCSYSTRVVLVLSYPPPRRQSPKDEKQENVQLGFTLQFNTIKNPSQSPDCSWRKLRPFSGLNSIFDAFLKDIVQLTCSQTGSVVALHVLVLALRKNWPKWSTSTTQLRSVNKKIKKKTITKSRLKSNTYLNSIEETWLTMKAEQGVTTEMTRWPINYAWLNLSDWRPRALSIGHLLKPAFHGR